MDLLKECGKAGRIGISAHIRPDGDAVGSSLALYLYLKKLLPDAEIKLYLEQVPASLSHLPHLDEVDLNCAQDEEFDVFFAMDTVPDRMGAAEALYRKAKKKINIDHHISNEKGCGDVNLVVPLASSAAEVVFGIMDERYVDRDIAVAIYTGMIHDTGVFQYSNTTPETLRTAARLIAYGFDFPKIIEESFYQKTYTQNQLMGRTLMESVLFMDGRCIVSCMDKSTLDFFGADSSDLDGIVNQLRNTKGVDCAIFMREVDTMEYRVSLRSNEKVDVSKIAVAFGGGGHVRAAGCTMKGTRHDVINNLSRLIEGQLEAQNV